MNLGLLVGLVGFLCVVAVYYWLVRRPEQVSQPK
jgi:hypothetical protein